MSLLEPSVVDTGVAFTALLLGLAAGIGVVAVRRSFYAILWLAFAGVAVAMFMALIGFTYLAVFHLLIYVGATVAFLMLVMTAVGEEKESDEPEHSVGAAIVASLASIAVLFPLMSVSKYIKSYSIHTLLQASDIALWAETSKRIFIDFWPATLIALIALVAMLVEVVAVARKS